MRGDFTRRSFRPQKRYSSVRMQQGRVQLDSDWNEQVEIQQQLSRTETQDTIGQTGIPAETPFAFQIAINSEASAGNAIQISDGRMYVDGILCVNEEGRLNDRTTTYQSQPFFPVSQSDFDAVVGPVPSGGVILVYLDVWERLITAFEDAALLEPALGGPDTTARSQVIWQVKLLPQKSADDARNINLKLRFGTTELPTLPVTVDVNAPPAGNQLYRLEVHKSADETGKGATFKWSRDNGSVVAEWVNDSNPVEVKSRTRFRAGQFLELTDDDHELLEQPGLLCKIDAVTEELSGSQKLRLVDPDGQISDLTPLFAAFKTDGEKKKKARLWDSAARAVPNDGILALLPDGGLAVSIPTFAYRTGDAWLIPVRQGMAPATALPAEDGHHYAKLAILQRGSEGELSRTADLRRFFEPIVELKRKVDGLTEQVTNIIPSIVPRGVILMWSGTIATIPTGWVLCDGRNGTPDLRARFILGSGADRTGLPGGVTLPTPLASGEHDPHDHSFNVPTLSFNLSGGNHVHQLGNGGWGQQRCAPFDTAGGTTVIDPRPAQGANDFHATHDEGPGGHTHSANITGFGATSGPASGENRPRWFALCYIMKT